MTRLLKRTITCLAAFGALALVVGAGPAHAADRDHGHDRGRRDDHRGHYYAAPPPVYYDQPGAYAPPPVVVGAPGISIGINIP